MGKELCVKGIYGSGMVIQRDKINCIYGTGDVFSDVIMSFRGVTSITQVDENGEWKFDFAPGDAGGPFNMVIKSGTDKIEFSDIYVGEVWINAGEGNAQMSMDRLKYSYPEEFQLPENKNVRMISIPINYSFNEKIDFVEEPLWKPVAPYSIGDMPGVGYFFAKKLSVDLGVPVGIINISHENVPIVSWISKKGLEEMGDKEKDLETLAFYENSVNVYESERKVDKLALWNNELLKSIPDIDINEDVGWQDFSVPGILKGFEDSNIIWLKKEIELTKEQINHFMKNKARLWLGLISCADEVFINGVRIGFTRNKNRVQRFEVDFDLFKAGKNIILVKLMNSSADVKFYGEKPYCLFSGDVYVAPAVSRNIGVKGQSLAPIDGEYISLEGQWKVKAGLKSRKAPTLDVLEAKPTAIYNGVLPACFKYAIAGVIWYQGESDLERAGEYKGLLTKLITVWRRRFTYWSRDLPFVIVQLPNWVNEGVEGELSIDSNLSVIRKAQSDVAELIDRVGLAVSIDAGEWNDLYPEKKFTIGTRCEFEALRIAYGKSFISPAPKANFCEIKDDKYIVKFDCGNSSLNAFAVNGMSADLSQEDRGGAVYGFSFLYKKGGNEKGGLNVAVATAKLINSNSVEVTIPEECIDNGCEIVELRYLWGDCPAPVNLYSRDMIPASPFVMKTK